MRNCHFRSVGYAGKNPGTLAPEAKSQISARPTVKFADSCQPDRQIPRCLMARPSGFWIFADPTFRFFRFLPAQPPYFSDVCRPDRRTFRFLPGQLSDSQISAVPAVRFPDFCRAGRQIFRFLPAPLSGFQISVSPTVRFSDIDQN